MTEQWNGETVFKIARHRKLTQQQLADFTYLDRSTLSRVETGKRNFTMVEQMALSVVFNLPMDVLFPQPSEVEQAEKVPA